MTSSPSAKNIKKDLGFLKHRDQIWEPYSLFTMGNLKLHVSRKFKSATMQLLKNPVLILSSTFHVLAGFIGAIVSALYSRNSYPLLVEP